VKRVKMGYEIFVVEETSYTDFLNVKRLTNSLCLRNGRKVVEKRIDGDEAKSVVEFFARDLDAFCMYIGKSL